MVNVLFLAISIRDSIYCTCFRTV